MVRPPEFLLDSGNHMSFSADIWTLACLIWDILGQRTLFESFFATEDTIMSEQIDILGRSGLPDSWWHKWERRSNYFTEAGAPLADRHVPSWEGRFEKYTQKTREDDGFAKISLEEKEALFAMIRPMLTFKPEDRCTAAQVLESEWMTQWALPEYQKIKS
ncbi:kinase domain protein [Hypoxylon cercidicola]|nr:kinase domain protein [Hypoxylon cercidicola]